MSNKEVPVKEPVKTVKGPKAAVATFTRPRDGVRIWVYCRRQESADDAIARVMARNGAKGGTYERVA